MKVDKWPTPDLTLKVASVQLLTGVSGPDVAFLEIDLPEGIWPFEGKASLRLDMAKGKGEEYAVKHLAKEKDPNGIQ